MVEEMTTCQSHGKSIAIEMKVILSFDKHVEQIVSVK